MTRILYYGRSISFGKNFLAESIPKIVIDKGCSLIIGNNVLLRATTEIRIHKKSKIIIGNNVRIDRGVRLLSTNESEIIIKDGARIGLYSVLNGGDSIYIGEKALISGFVYLQASMHNYNINSSIQNQGFTHSPVILENDTWLGTHVVIMPGVKISEGSVVGSNAVVTKNFEKNSILAGVPAKIINQR